MKLNLKISTRLLFAAQGTLRTGEELLRALPRRGRGLRHRGIVGRGLLLAHDEEVDAYVCPNCSLTFDMV